MASLRLSLGSAETSSRDPNTGVFELPSKCMKNVQCFSGKFGKFAKKKFPSNFRASRDALGLSQERRDIKLDTIGDIEHCLDPFYDMKHRFLNFKRKQYLSKSLHFQNLAEAQSPKFMVIACADSRVCPSVVLGLEPGDAFTIRNVANLVPPFEKGPTETNAALEFAVNTLLVPNILVIGHTRCGGIQALMSMPDKPDSSFIRNWVIIGKGAKLKVNAAASNLNFEEKCSHCEKESINQSLMNLLSYPWIKQRVDDGSLSIHGGYYNFINCSFEKWTLDFASIRDGFGFAVKDHAYWN